MARSWPIQVLFHSVTVACAVTVAIFAPWPLLQVPAGIFALMFVVSAGRNPVFAYRRLFRRIVLVGSGASVLGASGRIAGATNLPLQLGKFDVLVEWGQGPLLWLILGLAALCLIGDIVVTTMEAKRSQQMTGTAELTVTIAESDAGTTLEGEITFPASHPEGVVVTEAYLVVGGLWPRKFKGAISRKEDRLEIPIYQPIKVDIGKQVTLLVKATLKAGIHARCVVRRGRPPLVDLLSFRGELGLQTAVGQRSISLPVCFATA